MPREKVQIATKFGVVSLGPPCLVVRGDPQYVRVCCESSLKRLGVDYIDLYYQHRVDQSVPIEDTVCNLMCMHIYNVPNSAYHKFITD